MISYDYPPLRGRLGNKLFQYAFLRTTSQRLNTKFHCSNWIGDKIFLLNDKEERAEVPGSLNKIYKERRKNKRFDKNAFNIEDGTIISGWFQAEDYFDQEKVKKWYTFNVDEMSRVIKKYSFIDFSDCTGIHLRFGDKEKILRYVIPRLEYYKEALTHIKHKKHILVFSDDILKAKNHLGITGQNFIYIENNKDYEDLYLMSLCHDFICSPSTFCWWGSLVK